MNNWWKPKPVMRPQVDPEFMHMDGLTRATESWRYNLLSLEFWLSPDGFVREFIRWVVWVALIIAAPAFLILPVVTFVLASLLQITVLVASIAWKIVVLVFVFVVGAVITGFNWLMFKAFISSRGMR